jgi:hypothetical protein
MQAAALDLARAKWSVFPCFEHGPRAKSPRTEHGHLDATRDEAQIREWWTRWPQAMIGAPVPDTLLVIDVDPRNGGSVDALEAIVGPLPDTLTAWSGRGDGGRHFYFLRPWGTFSSVHLPAGIDLKVNGYCILPPSLHPATGQPYRWDVHEAASVPLPLLAMLRPPAPVRAPNRPTEANGEPLVRFVAALGDGNRNRGLYWAACTALDEGTYDAIRDDLVRAAVGVGLTEREARRTVESAARQVTK